jgi:hypothetical protein
MASNRQIHAVTAEGHSVTRYDRAGKWYEEGSDGHRQIKFAEAVRLALEPGSRVIFGRSGGLRFDRAVREAGYVE